MTRNDPTIIIRVKEDIVVLTGTPEEHVIQSTNAEYVKQAKENSTKDLKVPLIPGFYKEFPTGSNTMLELVASIVAIAPYHSSIQQAPVEILRELEV